MRRWGDENYSEKNSGAETKAKRVLKSPIHKYDDRNTILI